MTELLDDYTKAEFPLDIVRDSCVYVRLYGTMSGKVFGVTYFQYEGRKPELSQPLVWDAQGIYSSGEYPAMNLPPPPALAESRIAELEDEIAAAQGRLDAMPDAPAEWRAVDERRIASNQRTIKQLLGVEP